MIKAPSGSNGQSQINILEGKYIGYFLDNLQDLAEHPTVAATHINEPEQRIPLMVTKNAYSDYVTATIQKIKLKKLQDSIGLTETEVETMVKRELEWRGRPDPAIEGKQAAANAILDTFSNIVQLQKLEVSGHGIDKFKRENFGISIDGKEGSLPDQVAVTGLIYLRTLEQRQRNKAGVSKTHHVITQQDTKLLRAAYLVLVKQALVEEGADPKAADIDKLARQRGDLILKSLCSEHRISKGLLESESIHM